MARMFKRFVFQHREWGHVELTRYHGHDGEPRRCFLTEASYNRFVYLANNGKYFTSFVPYGGEGHWDMIRSTGE